MWTKPFFSTLKLGNYSENRLRRDSVNTYEPGGNEPGGNEPGGNLRTGAGGTTAVFFPTQKAGRPLMSTRWR